MYTHEYITPVVFAMKLYSHLKTIIIQIIGHNIHLYRSPTPPAFKFFLTRIYYKSKLPHSSKLEPNPNLSTRIIPTRNFQVIENYLFLPSRTCDIKNRQLSHPLFKSEGSNNPPLPLQQNYNKHKAYSKFYYNK